MSLKNYISPTFFINNITQKPTAQRFHCLAISKKLKSKV